MKYLTVLLLSVLMFSLESMVQAQQSAVDEDKAKDSNPWETPADFVLYMAQQYKDISVRDIALVDLSESLANCGDIERALEVAEEIEDVKKKDVAKSKIATSLSMLGNTNQSLETIQRMGDRNGRTYVLMKIASALSKNGRTEDALKMIHVIETPASKVVALCDLASSLSKSGDKKQALTILKQTKNVVDKMDNPISGDMRTEIKKLESMLLESTDEKQAKEILKKLIELGDKDIDVEQARKRAAALTEIATALAVTGEVEQALGIADNLAEWHLRAAALKSIAKALVSTGEIKQALSVIQNNAIIEELAQKINLPVLNSIRFERATTLKAISIAMADMGDLKQALQIAKTINNKSSKSLALQKIASHLAEEGEFEQAFRVTDLITFEQVRSETLGRIALALAKSGDIKRALETVEQIEDVSIVDRSDAFEQIAYHFAEINDSKQAVDMASKIKIARDKAETLLRIASIQAKMGNTKAALATIDKVLMSVQKIKFEENQTAVLYKTVSFLVEEGELTKALEVAEQLKYDPNKDDPERFWLYDKSDAFRIIASSYFDKYKVRKAMQVIQKIEDRESRINSLFSIAKKISTEPVSDKSEHDRRMKKKFTNKEKQRAQQLVETVRNN
tara:strand:+ start:1241 stop:3112 length:1872 start_codon:yes stop_codon:yes gene_type:complete